MQAVAFDFETSPIRPALLAPPPVCLTWQRPGLEARICVGDDMRVRFRDWLDDPETLFIGANTAFDMAVAAEAWPELRVPIFKAYDADRVTDVQFRQRLLDIAGGQYLGRFGKGGVYIKYTYDLEALARRVAGMILEKDEWRLSYGNFLGLSLDQWPARARLVQAEATVALAVLERDWVDVRPKDLPKEIKKRMEGLRSMVASDPMRCTEYPLDDARATLAVWQKQEAHAAYLEDQYRQARAYFALHLGSAWGLRTDATGVEILRRETTAAHEEVRLELVEAGLVRPDGTRDTKVAKRLMVDVCAREGLRLRRTDGHTESSGKCKRLDGTVLPDEDEACEDHVCLDEEACNATEDETLMAYAEFGTLSKVLSTDVKALLGGVSHPIHTRYGLAETGRTTSSGKKS